MNSEKKHSNGLIVSPKTNPSYRKILRDAKKGEIIKIRNGLYITYDSLTEDMIDIEKIIPGGILCLYSAWHYYGMTTQVPDAFYVAIDRKRKVRISEALDIKIIYQSEKLLDIGMAEININNLKVKIYDRERCLCDAIKYRNKIGMDAMSEILNSYLNYPYKNFNRLSQYAKKLRVHNLLTLFLNVKL